VSFRFVKGYEHHICRRGAPWNRGQKKKLQMSDNGDWEEYW